MVTFTFSEKKSVVSGKFFAKLAQRKDEKCSRRLQPAPTPGAAKTSPMMASLFVYLFIKLCYPSSNS
jgi:hypothetical protein